MVRGLRLGGGGQRHHVARERVRIKPGNSMKSGREGCTSWMRPIRSQPLRSLELCALAATCHALVRTAHEKVAGILRPADGGWLQAPPLPGALGLAPNLASSLWHVSTFCRPPGAEGCS